MRLWRLNAAAEAVLTEKTTRRLNDYFDGTNGKRANLNLTIRLTRFNVKLRLNLNSSLLKLTTKDGFRLFVRAFALIRRFYLDNRFAEFSKRSAPLN